MTRPVSLFAEMDAPMIGLCVISVAISVAATAEAQPGAYLFPLALCAAFNLGIMLLTRGVTGITHKPVTPPAMKPARRQRPARWLVEPATTESAPVSDSGLDLLP